MMDGSGNTASLCEIWPYVANAAASFDDPMKVVEQRENININKKQRQDNVVDDDDGVSTSNASTTKIDGDSKRVKTLAIENENSESKPEDERSAGKKVDNSVKQSEPPKDYIHVRARRGQATDSHSLAERARREKISERMKILQDIVPGCNKVIGKASVLDEIINYIQSLQQQVEFLSMKLEAVTSRSHPSPQGFPSKDFGQQSFDMSGDSPQGNSVTDCHQNGCTCKSVAALKEHHDFH